MKILGISAFYHDSAAAIINNGIIIGAAQEERFTRKKHDSTFPVNAIKYCLETSGFSLDELDAIVFYDKPFLKFERLIETYYGFAPKGILSFILAIPIWLKEKLFLKRLIYQGLNKVGLYTKQNLNLLFPEHHLSHAASAFYPSPFNEAAIVVIDGVGEWATTSIYMGRERKIEVIKELRFPHSVGLLYSAFTYYLGFSVNSGEYKLMGLAPYGNPSDTRTREFVDIIKKELIDLKEDGALWLNQEYFNYTTGLKMVKNAKWLQLFGFPRRIPESPLEQDHCNLAFAIQKVTEEIILKIIQEAKRITGAKNLCLAGGVALNCVANGKIVKEKIFENVFIQPAAGDSGGSLGAALAANYIYFGQTRDIITLQDSMQGAYLGPYFSDKEIELTSLKYKAVCEKIADFNKLSKEVAKFLADGKIIGWFQGRMEFGPRALGNRSILGDARNKEMQRKLNLKIKKRENFRPFAPAVLADDKSEYFDLEIDSPYMLLVGEITAKRKSNLPDNYFDISPMDRLYINRSDIPSITHVDFSSRVQTVHRRTNKPFWTLINQFKKITGYGIIINTSFNIRDEPIVCTPEDAYLCFMRTELDYLVMGNYLYAKEKQPKLESH